MSRDDQSRPPESAVAEASAWIIRLDRGLTADEQDRFSQWLASDDRHGEALAAQRRHWDRLAPLAHWRPEHSLRPNPDLLAPPPRPLIFRRWGWMLAAACLAGLLFWQPWSATAPGVTSRTVVVRESTSSRRVLDDGSVVELNRGGEFTVAYSAAERRVVLGRGEAHFTVVKNPARPFVVSVRGMEVRAVGTAFNVRVDEATVEVLVTDGRVRVDGQRHAAAPAPVATDAEPSLVPMLEAGQRAVVPLMEAQPAPRIATLTPGEIERVLAWQHRMLDFTAAPLREVLAEFNRFNRTQIRVSDPELEQVKVSASFRSDNVDGFVRLLELGFGIRGDRAAGAEIVLRKAQP